MTKIIFWIDNSFSNFFLAKKLNENSEFEIHSIFDVSDNPKKYFQNQTFVKFSSDNFYHDHMNEINTEPDIEYLKKKESEYNLNFMELLLNDRHFYNFNDFHNFTENQVFKILELEIKFFESILEKINPDYVIMRHVFLRNGYLFNLICKSKGIKILIPIPTRLGNRCIISDDLNNLGRPSLSNNENKINDTDFNNFKTKYDLKTTEQEIGDRFLQSRSEMLKASTNYLFSSNSDLNTHYTHIGRTKYQVFKNYFFDIFRTKIRKNFIDKNFKYNLPQNLKYVYFPLHVEQEHTLLIYAPFFTNQLELIKNILKSLPIDYKLVIKEHPRMYNRSWHSIEFYKEILNLPNTILIHPSLDSNELLSNCALTIAIRSSITFEAGYYDKPAIICTKTDYDFLPHVFRLTDITELPKLIRNALDVKINNSDFRNYLLHLENNSFDFEPDGLAQDLSDLFYYGGYYTNVLDIK